MATVIELHPGPQRALTGDELLREASSIARDHLNRHLNLVPLDDPHRAEVEELASPPWALRSEGA